MTVREEQADLRRTLTYSLVKSGDALEIIKEYLSFAVARKEQYYIVYKGRMYRDEQVRGLFDELRPDE